VYAPEDVVVAEAAEAVEAVEEEKEEEEWGRIADPEVSSSQSRSRDRVLLVYSSNKTDRN
jgi:hypothetical protein